MPRWIYMQFTSSTCDICDINTSCHFFNLTFSFCFFWLHCSQNETFYESVNKINFIPFFKTNYSLIMILKTHLNLSCMSATRSRTACMKSSCPAICDVTTENWCHLYLSRMLNMADVWCSNDGANWSWRLDLDALYKNVK